MRARSLISLILLLPLVIAVAACGSQSAHGPKLSHLTLWLDYTPWGAHVPIYAAQKQGYFRREGIDLSIRAPANADPLLLVAANSDTLGIGYMSDVVTAEAKGIPVESIGALVQHHLNCIMTLKSSGITSPRQLAGKTMGEAETPADNVILDTVYKHANVVGKVQAVNVSAGYAQALLSHRVDAIEGAYQVWERIQIALAGRQVNVIQLQKWGVPDEYELVLLSNRHMIHAQPGLIARFMRALAMGVDFSVGHPSAAIDDFLAMNPASPFGTRLVSRSWHLLIPFFHSRGVTFASQSGSRWSRLAAWMARNHLVGKQVPLRDLFTNKFVDRSPVKL